MRILVTGAAGMLGRDVAAVLSSPPGHDLVLVDREELDIADEDAVARFFKEARPDAVIHTAAYTDVDACEREPETAMLINGAGTANVARAARAGGARLLYISTDYVFDGSGRPPYGEPYGESDEPRPINSYGRSKLAGETAVRQNADSLIVRTSWLYGRHGRHFVGSVLDKARRGEALRIVDDQVGRPTWSLHLAQALAALVGMGARGIVNVTGGGAPCSWYEFAVAILEEARTCGMLSSFTVDRMSSGDLERPAARPAYSVLSDRRLRELGMEPLPEWRSALREFLSATV